MSQFKLGKRPAVRPHGLMALDSYILGRPPQPPTKFARPDVSRWGVLGNDQYGDCLAEGTLVEAAAPTGGLRASYSGPVVRLLFESGKRLTVTPNHAVLTPEGFRPARLLNEGDYAVGTRGPDVGRLGGNQDLNHAPAPVEEVLAALKRGGAGSAQHAHGREVVDAIHLDGDERFIDGYVDVVRANRLLEREVGDPALRQPYRKQKIGRAGEAQGALHRLGAFLQGPMVGLAPPLSLVGSGYLRSPLLLSHGGVAPRNVLSAVADFNPRVPQKPRHSDGADPGLMRERDKSLAGTVSLKQRLKLGRAVSLPESRSRLPRPPDLVASGSKPTGDGRPTDPQLFGNLVDRFPGLVERDRLVEVHRDDFSGHVYDISTPTHWYVANGIITHNCTIAGAAHVVMATEAELPFVEKHDFTTDEVTRQYFEITGGPDSGCVEAEVLQLWHTKGLFNGQKCGPFAPVPPRNVVAVHRAIAFYGAAYIGVALPESAQQQFAAGRPWEVVPGSPVEGGHCIVPVAYDPSAIYCVTWGQIVAVTWPWWATYVDEVWCIVSDAAMEAKHGPGVLDLQAMEADLSRLAA